MIHLVSIRIRADNSPFKIDQIKLLRTLSGIGLKEAKDIVDAQSEYLLSLACRDGLVILPNGESICKADMDSVLMAFDPRMFTIISVHFSDDDDFQEVDADFHEVYDMKPTTRLELYSRNRSVMASLVENVGGDFLVFENQPLAEFIAYCSIKGIALSGKKS